MKIDVSEYQGKSHIFLTEGTDKERLGGIHLDVGRINIAIFPCGEGAIIRIGSCDAQRAQRPHELEVKSEVSDGVERVVVYHAGEVVQIV